MSSSGTAVGLNKGFPVTKRAAAAKPSHAKGVSVKFYQLLLFLFVGNF